MKSLGPAVPELIILPVYSALPSEMQVGALGIVWAAMLPLCICLYAPLCIQTFAEMLMHCPAFLTLHLYVWIAVLLPRRHASLSLHPLARASVWWPPTLLRRRSPSTASTTWWTQASPSKRYGGRSSASPVTVAVTSAQWTPFPCVPGSCSNMCVLDGVLHLVRTCWSGLSRMH